MLAAMMPLAAFVPIDRRLAGGSLPDRLRGSVLFADISGFTPMTQLLVEKFGPRRGPELLTEELERVYDALITEVHRFRGSVTGFSGDAITVFFDEATGVNAVGCGLALQEVMARLQRDGKRVCPLAIKIGLAAGNLRRFIVGDPEVQIFDVLAGHLLDRMAAAEKHARPGDVVVDHGITAALKGRLHIAETRGPVDAPFDVVQSITEFNLPVPWPTDEVFTAAELRPWVVAPLRKRLERGSSFATTELRTCVALFLQFEGIDFDADDTAGVKLDAYIRWVQSVVSAQEGVLLEIITGDKGNYLYIAFGAPIAHQDDVARAVSAATQLVHPPTAIRDIRGVRIGLNQGRMRVGPYGSLDRRTYSLLGSPVNIAARLMIAARTGEVLVTDRVARAAQDRFHFAELPPIKVKGVEAPLQVAALRGRHVSGARARHANLPFIGRQDERAAVDAALAAFAAGEGRILVIEGEAGIGKSRLAAHTLAMARAQGIGLLVGNGDQIERGMPFSAWRGVLLQALGVSDLDGTARCDRVLAQISDSLRSDAPLLAPLLGLDLPEPPTFAALSPSQRAARIFDLIVDLLGHLSWPGTRHPNGRLLLIEDAQWLDSLSWELLMQVQSRLQPLFCVITTRPLEEPVPRAFSQLTAVPTTCHLALGSLSPDEITELARQRLGVLALPPDVIYLIRSRAGGNPFFSEELALALLDSGRIRIEDGRCLVTVAGGLTEDSVPDTVEGLIVERIDRLSIERQLALKVASVFGRIFSVRAVTEIYPSAEKRGDLPSDLESLAALAITVVETPEPELHYAFKHIITQQVAYDLLLFQQRRSLHRQAAEWIERQRAEDLSSVYALLVYHWDGAEDPRRTLHYLKLAGDEASRTSAYAEAVIFYQRALALLDGMPDRDVLAELRLQIALAVALMTTKGQGAPELERAYSRARELCQQMGQREELPPELFSVLWGLWRFYFLRAQHQTARELAAQCLDLAQRVNEPSLLLVAHHAVGTTALFLAELSAAQTHLDQGSALYDLPKHRALAFRHGHDIGVWCLSYQAWIRWHLGYPEQALKLSNEALALAGKLDHPVSLAAALFYKSRMHSLLRDAPAVQKYAEAGLSLARERGFPMWASVAKIQLAAAMVLRGQGKEALECLKEEIAAHQASGAELDRPRMLAVLSEAYGSAGDTEAGLTLLAEGLAVVNKTEERILEADLLWLRGELLLKRPGPSDEAEVSFRQAIEVARKQQAKSLELRAAVSLSRLWKQQGKTQPAQALLVDVYSWFTEGFATADLQAARDLLKELA